MNPMYLPEVEQARGGPHGDVISQFEKMHVPVPQLFRLTAFKPDRSLHLCRLAQAVMRGPSPLSAGFRELIAAFVSRGNECAY